MVIDLCSISPKLASHIALANAHRFAIVAFCFNVRHDDLTRALTSTRRSTPFMFTVAFAVRSGPERTLTTRQGTIAHDTTTSPCFVFLVPNFARFPAVLGRGVARFLTHAYAVVV